MSAARFRRLEARVRLLQWLGRVAFLTACFSAGFVVVATGFPQLRTFEALERKLDGVKQHEALVYGERDQAKVEQRALVEDPEFLELHARDRLDYYREGERVFRFRRGGN